MEESGVNRELTLFCDAPELALEATLAAEAIESAVQPNVLEDPISASVDALAAGTTPALLLSSTPSPEALVGLAHATRVRGVQVAVCLLGAPPGVVYLARDLGLVAVREVRPLLAATALLELASQAPGSPTPWTASTRALSAVDKARLASALRPGDTPCGRLTREDRGRLAYAANDDAAPALLGEARDVAVALDALREADIGERPPMPAVEGVDPQQVLDVVFGPPRALSDPASKAALSPYDVPLPEEELCTSPSRAAAEAGRMGFPVRIALASPDLRIWDHPDLAADGVDNAARVRDVFRQVMALARARAPHARLLGVTVGATTSALALLWLRMTPLSDGLVHLHIGFADPHGAASDDATQTVLPATFERIESTLARLRGAELILGGSPLERRRAVQAVGDVLLRLAAFAHDWRDNVDLIQVDPLALLVGGDVEVREACIEVSDAFARSLDTPQSA